MAAVKLTIVCTMTMVALAVVRYLTTSGSGEDDLADYNQNEAADYCNE
jgi:hypothetical protein